MWILEIKGEMLNDDATCSNGMPNILGIQLVLLLEH